MAERTPPPMESAQPEPRGEAQYARFGGILEGRRTASDAPALRSIARKLNGLGLAPADLELEGGRFTLMLSEDELPPSRWMAADHDAFVALLQQLVAASADPMAVESTLRCTEVYEEDVIETLFAVVGGEIKAVSRLRPAQESDRRRRAPGDESGLPPIGGRQAGILAALLLAVFGILAWQGGWIDRAFSADIGGAALETGPFGDLLAVEVETRWGNYALELKRGPAYPDTTAALEALLAAAATPADRAAVAAVGDGGAIYAQVVDEQGVVLASTELLLRPLLSQADARIEGRLPGRIEAHALRLALDPGKRAK